MAQDKVPSSQPSPDNSKPDSKSAAGKPKKHRLRRLLIWGAATVLVLLIVLILLIPTIVSSGMVRGIVVRQVNAQLNGRVEIDDWSLGWSSGFDVKGVRVFDNQNRQMVELRELKSAVSLVSAIFGNINLGDTQIDGLDLNAVRDAKGNINLANLAKPSGSAAVPISNGPLLASITPPLASAAPAGSGTSISLPNISCNLHLNDARATVQDAKAGLINVQHLNVNANLSQNAGVVDLTIPVLSLQVNDDAFKLQLDPKAPIHVQQSADGTMTIDQSAQIPISYDLAKLWAIAKPIMVTSPTDPLADAKFSGAFQRTIVISGSFPSAKPFTEAIKSIQAWGAIALGESYAEGISLALPNQPADIPFTVANGHLRTVYHDKPEGQNEPAAIPCNSGTLSLAGIYNVDLTDPNMATTREKPGDLLVNVSLNPALATFGLGDILNVPTFVGAKDAKGLLSVKVLKMDKVPLSGAFMNPPSGVHYALGVQYSITGLVIGSDMIDQIVSKVSSKGSSISTGITDATVNIVDGVVAEDSTMMINSKDPLRIAGNVKLADRTFAPMTIYLPVSLFGGKLPAGLSMVTGSAIPIPLEGSMTNPKISFDKAAPKTPGLSNPGDLLHGLMGK